MILVKETILKRSSHVDNVVLTANTAHEVTIPSGGYSAVLFSFDQDVWVRFGGDSISAAVVPSSTTTDGTGVILNPTSREFLPTDTKISIISASDAKGSLEYI